MEYRLLGNTGIKVSEIGFGAWAIGGDAWGPVEDTRSKTTLERALSLIAGVNLVLTGIYDTIVYWFI